MAEPLRLAVLGTGSISLRGILPHCTMPDVQDRLRVTAVCDTVPGRARAAADRFGVPQAFESYDALLRKGDFDAVSIATPIGLHYEQGKQAVEAGKHCHFNKTMTTTVDEADDLLVRMPTVEGSWLPVGVQVQGSPGPITVAPGARDVLAGTVRLFVFAPRPRWRGRRRAWRHAL